MKEIVLLDGSIGQEIVKRSGDRATPLWSTSVMIEKPEIVGEVHDAYFQAGATVATTNTYAVHRDRLRPAEIEAHYEELLNKAVNQAVAARDKFGSGQVAASLGPLMASYRPDICPPAEEAQHAYAEQVELIKDRVDLFLIETASSVDQARGALMGCANAGKPVWLAVTVADDDGTRLRSGEALSDLAGLVAELNPDAVLVNCSRPEVIAEALDIIAGFEKPFGAYANGFTRISEGFLGDRPTVDALEQRKDLDPDAYADFAMGWVDQGATIVGGCCEVGPDHIAELARRLTAAEYKIV